MPDLNFIDSVHDEVKGAYISGWSYNGFGEVKVTAAPVKREVGWGMAINAAKELGLGSQAPVKVTTITIAGIQFGAPGTSVGDSVTIDLVSPDGTTRSATYIYVLGDTVADFIAAIQAAFDDAQDGAVTVAITGGAIVVTDVVGLTDSETELTLTFVDTTPNETAWTLPTFTNTVEGVTAEAAVKATAALAFTGVGVDTQTFTVNDETYTLLTVLVDAPGNILIGADQTATCNNIVSAIMGTAGAGTTYGTGTTAPTGVDFASRAATTVTFRATTAGAAANAFASTETCTNASFTNGATFSGGADAVAAVLNVVTGAPDLKVATVDATGASALQDLDAVVGILDPAA